MKILSTKRFEFVGDDKKTFVTSGGMVIESAPDWIQKCELFGLAVADGSINVLKETVASGSDGSVKSDGTSMTKAEKAAAKKAAEEAAKLAEEEAKKKASEEAAAAAGNK